MNYSDIHKGMRVRPVELFGELDIEQALHLNPGTVIEEPESHQFEVHDDDLDENMIRVKHDDGRVMYHTADELEAEEI